MFTDQEIRVLKDSEYSILQINHHDATIHSDRTGHDWIIVSNYKTSDCYILHRHSVNYPYHRQRGNYKSLKAALKYINRHEEWFFGKRRWN